MIHQNSLESFQKILTKVNKRQNQILQNLFWFSPQTDAMIADSIHLPINCVTPRRGELKKLGLVEEFKRDICLKTGGTATFWQITQRGKEVTNWRIEQEKK